MSPPARLNGARVLVVEDHEDSRELLGELLRAFGAIVRTEGDATCALAAFGAFRPDVVVSNIAMPGVDGCSLLGSIRALGAEGGGGVPAIAVTGYLRGVDRARFEAAGFRELVAKPIDPSDLARSLERALAPL